MSTTNEVPLEITIRRMIAESDKFVAEQRKLMAESAKLERERWLLPSLAVASVLGGAVGFASGLVTILGATGWPR